jgi:hypothetical protein
MQSTYLIFDLAKVLIEAPRSIERGAILKEKKIYRQSEKDS